VKHALQDGTDGAGGVSQPKPFVNASPSEIWLRLTKRERWIFSNRVVILTLIIHWLGLPLFLPRRSEATLATWSEGLDKGPYQKNTLAVTVKLCEIEVVSHCTESLVTGGS